MKEILVLGGGVAGSSLCYFLSQKGYNVTLIEKNKQVGGLSRTCYYAGHPYEFGPHIWFWPGGPEAEINKVIVELTNDELYYIERKLLTYVESERAKYRYPVHFADIEKMPDKDIIYEQLRENRDENWRLKEEQLPVIGECMFEDYFVAALGLNLYNKFMRNYTWKMWNIPGEKLKTSMVWADRFQHAYSSSKKGLGLSGYDPLKFEEHTLGKGISFQVYPKNGWNVVWDKMVADATVIQDTILGIKDEDTKPCIATASGNNYYFSDFHIVFSTLDIDELWGENKLPYTGRIMVPLLLPNLEWAFPENTESLHYASAEFQTRVTEMKRITRHESPDTLILIEIPVLPGSENVFPENALQYAMENNLYSPKAYPQQSEEALRIYNEYRKREEKIKNFRHCGRHAEFKYWGMPETVNSAYQIAKEF